MKTPKDIATEVVFNKLGHLFSNNNDEAGNAVLACEQSIELHKKSMKCTTCKHFNSSTSSHGQRSTWCKSLNVIFRDISQNPDKFSCSNWEGK